MPRKPDPIDKRLLSKVSKLYYEQELSQQEIAGRLQLSRPKVSRLLRQAREEGIVQITVLPPPDSHADLEGQLETRFGLLEAVVADGGSPWSPDQVAREVGAAAANYFHRTLQDGDVIGISWGTTLNAMVHSLLPQSVEGVHVVQLNGGLGPPEAEVHSTNLCHRLAQVLDARLTLLPAPGIVDTPAIKEAILSDKNIQHAMQLMERVTVAYMGVGAPTPDSVLMSDGTIMRQEQLDGLRAKGAVGDIALRFFDAEGRPVDSDLSGRTIGISLEQLQRIPRVIGVAGGLEKVDVIHAALKGKLINVLITDEAVARQILERG
jgi:DNA-binding transcriptional regulator LsrR (DeoR family)